MKMRRVSTGHNALGRAIVVSDSEVEPDTIAAMRGSEFHKLWGADSPQCFPDDGSQPVAPAYFPPLGGYRFGMFTLMPQSASQPEGDPRTHINEFKARLPGLAAHMEHNGQGMHTSDTVDFEYIVSGEVWLELDDGASILLHAGDTVVQNGTRHVWRNKSDEPCQVVTFMVGVTRQPSGMEIARLSRSRASGAGA
jgi:uncharacterized cupin superfamily protein